MAFDREVLVKAVKDGVGRLDAPFAYATGKSPEGYHTGLVLRTLGTVYFDERSLLVHPEHVVAPPEVKVEVTSKEGTKTSDGGGKTVREKPEPVEKVISRYYGRVAVDAQRVNKEMGLIVEEVIQRLTSQVGCEVEITIEIKARKADGFEESTIRTLSENSRTLKFEHYGFEEA